MVGWVGREVNTVEAGGREGKREKVAREKKGKGLDLQLKGQQCVHHNVTSILTMCGPWGTNRLIQTS